MAVASETVPAITSGSLSEVALLGRDDRPSRRFSPASLEACIP